MTKLAFWLLLAGLFLAGYATRSEQERRTDRAARVAADSALRDARNHLALYHRANEQLATRLALADSAIAREHAAATRSADRARVAEAEADTIRAKRGTKPPLHGTTAHDSLEFYRAQLIDADLEVAALRTALEERRRELASKDSIDRIRATERLLLVTAKDEAAAQLTRTMAALEKVQLSLTKSAPPCRGPLGIPCPSRKAVAIGAVVTVLAARQAFVR